MPSKKYRVIVKVGDSKFLKYHVNNLLKFTSFLDAEFPNWRFFNVFDYDTREQIANYTRNNKPITSKVF